MKQRKTKRATNMPLEIRHAGDEEDEEPFDDLVGDGFSPEVLLLLQGHYLAALAWLPSGGAAIAAELCDRLRRRGGGTIARELRALKLGSPAFAATLRDIAEQLRKRAEQLTPAKLSRVIDGAAAAALCTRVDAWLAAEALSSDETTTLAAHIAIGGELWGGLGDGRGFMTVPILKSGLDPATEPALEVDVDVVPPLRGVVSARLRQRTDPETMLGTAQTLRLVRKGTLMLCHAVDSRTATFAEATESLRLDLEATDG